MTVLLPLCIMLGQPEPDPGPGYRLLRRGEEILYGDECSFFDRSHGHPFFDPVHVIWLPADFASINDFYTENVGGFWIRRKVSPAGAVPGRNYSYRIGPNYLSVRIWQANQGGQVLHSTVVTVTPGTPHRERYDAIADAIRNVGCTPPEYEPTRHYHA